MHNKCCFSAAVLGLIPLLPPLAGYGPNDYTPGQPGVTETAILQGEAAALQDPPLQIVCRYTGRCPGQRAYWNPKVPIVASDFTCKWTIGSGVAKFIWPQQEEWWEGPPASALQLTAYSSGHTLSYSANGRTWSYMVGNDESR
jgi:hypothetical protein